MKGSPAPTTDGAHRRYRAFLSYSHRDTRWASWLHRKLESYRVPERLRQTPGAYGALPERLSPIFRDRDELASSGVLGAHLEDALAASEALVVICSPDAARSRWVDSEIRNFMASGRGERIYCLIVAGEPNSGDERECFPPALRLGPDVELVAADVRPGKDGRRLALQKLLAGLLGVELDSLRRREAQRSHRRMFYAVIASTAGMVLALGLATTAWMARNDAQRRQEQAQNLIVYMLGDLHRKLEKVGRLDLLGSLSDKAIDYLTDLDSRDLNDTTLKQLAQAMTQLGQVRIGQGQYLVALALFRSAYARSEALVKRHPGNGDMLFDRGQIEYWIGYVYWQSQELDQAQRWFNRYRDTSRAVYAIDPRKVKWQRELAYGEHNVAVIEYNRGKLADAERDFTTARRILTEALVHSPNDPNRIFEIADENSWLANVQEQEGNLVQAQVNLASKTKTMAGIVAAHPSDPNWKMEWSNAALLQARVLSLLGQFTQTESLASQVIDRMNVLVKHDPGNKDWGETYLHAFVLRAKARIGDNRLNAARADLARAAPLIASLQSIQSQNHLVRRDILIARQLTVWMALHDNDAEATRAAADALLAEYTDQAPPQLPEDIGRYGLSQVLLGMVDLAQGKTAQANAYLADARRVLGPSAQHTRYWRILDPWLRLSLLGGDSAETARARALLVDQNYVPVFPWPQPRDAPQDAGSKAGASAMAPNNHAPRAPARGH